MDAATNAFVFYMQQSHHDVVDAAGGRGGNGGSFKPPNYFDCHDLNRYGLSRDRQIRSRSGSSSSGVRSSTTSWNQNNRVVNRKKKEEGGDDSFLSSSLLLFPIVSPARTAVPDLQDLD